MMIKMSIGASLIGALLLILVYMGFIGLGAKYAPYLQDAQPEHLLVAIGGHALGYFAKPIIAIILAVGCLATAVILSTLFVDFLSQDLTNERLKRPPAIFITMVVTFAVSLLGFSKLMVILSEILDVAYPALIALAIMNIVGKLTPYNYTQSVFWIAFCLSTGIKVFG
jgi:LIVCS family branched-chain amino acid:cation transporter